MRHSTSNWGVDTRKKRMRLVRAIALTIPVDMYYGCTSFSWSDHPQNAAALLIWGLTTWAKVIRHLHFKKTTAATQLTLRWYQFDTQTSNRRRSIADSKKIISFQNLRPLDGSRHLTVRAFKLGRWGDNLSKFRITRNSVSVACDAILIPLKIRFTSY